MHRTALIEIDLSRATTSIELQELLRDSLDFPGWYGRNWNAFWDGITALVEMPEVLRLLDWRGLEARLPGDAKMMKECLEQMSDKYPELASMVVYA